MANIQAGLDNLTVKQASNLAVGTGAAVTIADELDHGGLFYAVQAITDCTFDVLFEVDGIRTNGILFDTAPAATKWAIKVGDKISIATVAGHFTVAQVNYVAAGDGGSLVLKSSIDGDTPSLTQLPVIGDGLQISLLKADGTVETADVGDTNGTNACDGGYDLASSTLAAGMTVFGIFTWIRQGDATSVCRAYKV